MVFRKIIGIIVNAAFPINKELPLLDPVSHPIEPHVNGLGATLFHGGVGNTGSASVIGLNWCGRLRVAHVGQDGAQGSTVFSIEEKSAEFGFSS